jgi:hypothetical protein
MGLEARAVLPLLLFSRMRSGGSRNSPPIVASLTSNGLLDATLRLRKAAHCRFLCFQSPIPFNSALFPAKFNRSVTTGFCRITGNRDFD